MTWRVTSSAEAPGQLAWITMVLMVKLGSSSPPKLQVGENARQHEDDHEIPEQRAVFERPIAKG